MSRDGNGNYTPPLNPVVGGQPIEADWANDTINDLAAALTDSLSRSGNGGMLASFRAVDGTVNIPAISFNNETNSGIYRAGTGDYRLCVNGKDKARIRDVNGMAAFQVFDLAGTGAWETLATSAEVGAITLADVLAVGNTTGGTDIVVGDGDLILGDDDIRLRPAAAKETRLETSAGVVRVQVTDTLVRLYYGATLNQTASKLETTDTGVTVTGTVDCDGLRMDDSEYAGFGDSDDLQIFHNGTNSYIQDVGTGILSIQSNGDSITMVDSVNARTMAKFSVGGTALLSWAGGTGTGTKLETTATGIDVTGTVEAGEFSGTGTVAITDFVTDVSTNDNDTTVPTTAAVKSYVDTAGGNETLAETLALGNTTGATDIEMTDNAKITSSNIIPLETPQFTVKLPSGSPLLTTGLESVRLYWQTTGAVGARLDTTELGVDISGEMVAESIQLNSPAGSPSIVVGYPIIDLYNRNLSGGTSDPVIGLLIGPTNYIAKVDVLTGGTAPATFAFTQAKTVAVEQGAEEGKYEIWVKEAGVDVNVLQVEATGVTVTGTVDLDNLTIATDQGTAGQVLKSTGSGIEWGSVGGETLAQTLALGSATGGTDIVLTDGDVITGTATPVIKPPAPYVGYGSPSIELQTSSGAARISTTELEAKLWYGTTGAQSALKLQTTNTGIDVIGDLDVTGTITSNAFAYSKATVNNAADILYTAFNSFAGKRIINTASATNTTYGLPTPVAADIGKSWIICNPTDSEITIDHDASGTANYIWIMDGVTLAAAASSWTIKKGAIVEIVVAAAAAGGGSSTAPNYLIFGAGLLEIV